MNMKLDPTRVANALAIVGAGLTGYAFAVVYNGLGKK